MPAFWYKECDPDNIEHGAVVYENDIPICRTSHLPGWEASDHDDLAQHLVTELFAAWHCEKRKPIQHEPVACNRVLAA